MSFVQPTITSLQNTKIKSVRRLHQASERDSQRKFLIEGPNLVQEAIAADWPLESIFIEAGALGEIEELFRQSARGLHRDGVMLQPVSRDVLRKLGTTDSVCPIVAVALQNGSREWTPTPVDLAIAVESMQDPGNLGSLIRIAVAAGLAPIILGRSSVDPTNPKVLRSTAGQWFRSPPVVADLESVLELQNARGVQTLAAAADGKSFWEFDFTRPTLFVLGNEGAGLSSNIRALTTDTVAIPMSQQVESLNVAICGALLAFEAQRQRRC